MWMNRKRPVRRRTDGRNHIEVKRATALAGTVDDSRKGQTFSERAHSLGYQRRRRRSGRRGCGALVARAEVLPRAVAHGNVTRSPT